MARRFNRQIASLVQSDIRAMSRACDAVGGINLGQGICDLPTHPLVQEGAIEAIRASRATYAPHDGIAPLRQAIARKMESYNALPCDPDSEIVVTSGSTGAFAMTMLALLEPGDEVILFEPYYSYHRNTVLAMRGEPVFVTLHGDAFAFEEAELRAAVTPRTRAIVVCTPNNPCGKVFTREELSVIAGLCLEHDLTAVTDEIYEYILYDGAEHVSLATLPGMRERTVTISGISKTFSVTGWRIGYAVAEPETARTIGVLSDLFYVCAPTPLQYGAARGLEVDPSYYGEIAAEYAPKRSLMAGAARGAGLTPLLPQGAYYMLADASGLGWGGARDAAHRLLAETGVACVPGSAFYRGTAGEHLLRFCFAKPDEALVEAGRRMSGIGSAR
jgi:aminotransferase